MNKEALRKIYITYRLAIFPFVVAFSCLVLIIFIIYPQTSTLIGSYKSEGKLQSDFKKMEAKAQVLESFDKADLNRKLQLALNVYPTDYDYANVIGVLQNMVGRFGFNLVALQVSGSGQQAKSSNTYLIRVEVTGPKLLLKDLINSIENYPRIMKVNSIDVSSLGGVGNVSVSLSITAYYQPLPGSGGDELSVLPAISKEEEELLTVLAKSQPTQSQTAAVPRGLMGKINPFE